MPLQLVDFWKQLVQSGLTDAEQLPQWAADFATDHGGRPPANAAEVAQWLVRTDRAAAFPVSQLLDQKKSAGGQAPPRFRIAPLTLIEASGAAVAPFEHWQRVTRDRDDVNDTPPSKGFVRQIDPTKLPAEAAQSLRAHATVRHASLQTIEIIPIRRGPLSDTALPESERRDYAGLYSPLPSGSLLNPATQPRSVRDAVKRLLPLCEATLAMHEAKLFHGEIAVHRIWQAKSGPWILLRNPWSAFSSDVIAKFTIDRQPWMPSPSDASVFWSPERIRAGDDQRPSIADDIHAIGCLGFWLRFGRTMPLTETRESLPRELVEAVEQGASGDPLARVLASAMALDPAARFASMQALMGALQAAASATPIAKPVPPAPVPPAPRPSESQPTKPAKKEPKSQTKPPTIKRKAVTLAKETSGNQKPARGSQAEKKNEPKPKVVRPTVAAVTPVKTTSVEVDVITAADGKPSELALAGVAPVRRRRKRRNQKAWYGIYALCIPVLFLVGALAVRDKNPPAVAKRIRPPVPRFIPRVSGDSERLDTTPSRQPTTPKTNDPKRPAIEVVDNDQMLWAPPSIDQTDANMDAGIRTLALLPPGPAAVIWMDWPQLRRTGLLDLFAMETQPWLTALQARAGVDPDFIASLCIAWFPGTDGVPEIAMAVRLKAAQPLDQLLEQWQVSSARAPGGETLYAGDTADALAYFPLTNGSPATDNDDPVDAFAVGSIARIGEVAEVGGGPIVLPRLLEELWQTVRPNDAIAFLSQPNFLVSDSRRWLEGTSPALVPWIRQNLLADCGGALVRIASADGGESSSESNPPLPSLPSQNPAATYVEVRLATSPGVDPTQLATRLRPQVDSAPEWANDFLVTREVDPSWRLLAARLPSMWSFATDNIRAGRVDRSLVWNAYLPPRALPQLTLATLLATNTTTMETAPVDAMANSEAKLTIKQMLDRPMSVSFDQESLQFAVDTIVDEFKRDLPAGNALPPVRIVGGDLQKMGITQNQQIRDFVKTNVPLRTVLTDLVLGANPDRTATGPSDPKQALVWVVLKDESEILITTRVASDGKYDLPIEFVP